MAHEAKPDDNTNKERKLIYLIHEMLGEISVEQYTNLPRKPKKTANKIASRKVPSQQALSRLAKSLRNSGD